MDELRSHYRELCLKFHPDKHSDNKEKWNQVFAEMYSEYEMFLGFFIPGENQRQERKEKSSGTKAQTFDFESETDIAKMVQDLMQYSGLIIEICGSWLWLTGETYRWRIEIKGLGFRWQDKKKAWYFAGYEFTPHKAKIMDMKHIRARYGSFEIETGQKQAIA